VRITRSGRTTTALGAGLALAVALSGCETSVPPSSDPAASATAPASAEPSPAGVPCDPASPIEVERAWWTERVFYEVFVRSFADSDGDGIGDFRGLTERLDYLNDGDPATTNDLGITGIWLMPIAESPSYHGYDVTDYERVEPDYGTEEDLRAFLAAARERGIAVITDFVINHTSSEHAWFEASRAADPEYADWYVWSDEHGGFGGPGGRPVWHEADGRYYYAYFWQGMPDLDLRTDAVTVELDRIARFWLEDIGVDGFRLDAARHLIEDGAVVENTPETFEWLARFRNRVHTASGDALVLGEVWDATSVASRYIREGALDLVFEFGLAGAMVNGIRFRDPATLAAIQAEVSAAYPAGSYATFLTNHDQDRVFDQLGRDIDAAKAAATLLLTSAGVPFIYYGEEIGMRGRKPDERIRTPLAWDATTPGAGFSDGEPWQPLADGLETANIAAQTADPASLLSHYRTLIRLRESPVLRHGELVPLSVAGGGAYAFARHLGEETVVVLVNLGTETVEEPSLSLASGPLCGEPAAAVLLGPDGLSVTPPTVLPGGGFDGWQPVASLAPRESVIIRLDR
jgi:alpha-amylase